jgi:hypothetical protein
MQMKLNQEKIPWAMAAGRAALGPVFVVGEVSGWSGVAMAWLVVTALLSDIRLENMPGGDARRTPFTRKTSIGALALMLALCVPTSRAFAAKPGEALYANGTSQIALDTLGTLDTTSPAQLIFRYKGPSGTPAEIPIAYTRIRSFEPRRDVVRHLGFLPALAAGLVAARQRTYTLTISYADSSDVAQVATFQLAERDQRAVEEILRALAPQSCMVTPYNPCAANRGPRPLPATTSASK